MTLVEQFQFLTRQQLWNIARAHGLHCTTGDNRPVLLNIIRSHRSCTCPSRYLRFGRITRPRQNIMQIQLHDPLAVDALQNHSRERHAFSQRASGRSGRADASQPQANVGRSQCQRDAVHASDLRQPFSTSFPDALTPDDKLNIIREWQERMGPACVEESACAVCGWGFPLSSLSMHQETYIFSG